MHISSVLQALLVCASIFTAEPAYTQPFIQPSTTSRIIDAPTLDSLIHTPAADGVSYTVARFVQVGECGKCVYSLSYGIDCLRRAVGAAGAVRTVGIVQTNRRIEFLAFARESRDYDYLIYDDGSIGNGPARKPRMAMVIYDSRGDEILAVDEARFQADLCGAIKDALKTR
jgi:hypothetical protein